MPTAFPCILISGNPIPLVYFSSGELQVQRDAVYYTARSYGDTVLGKRRRNVDSTMRLSFSRANGVTLRRFRLESGGSGYYAIDWIEVGSADLRVPALLCVGSIGPGMGEVRSETDKLAQVLAAWANERPLEANGAWSA